MFRRRLLICTCLALLTVVVSGRTEDGKPPPDSKEVEKLIKDLSCEEFTVREAATGKLINLGELAVPELEKALKSPDRETSRRAADILQEVRNRREEREREKLLAELDKTPLDKLIPHIAKNPDKVTAAEWKALGKLVEFAVAQTNKVSGTTFKLPVDLAALKTETNPHGTGGSRIRFVTSGFTQSYTQFGQSAIICSGNTKWITGVSNTVVVVDGDFEGATVIHDSVIICRGSFKRATGISRSIVLCGGDFGNATAIDNSVVLAAGFGRCNRTQDNVYVNLPEIKATNSRRDHYVTTKVDPLRLLRFVSKKDEK